MTLDNEQDRTIFMEVIEKTAFPGKFAEYIVDLKQRLTAAVVEKKDPEVSNG